MRDSMPARVEGMAEGWLEGWRVLMSGIATEMGVSVVLSDGVGVFMMGISGLSGGVFVFLRSMMAVTVGNDLCGEVSVNLVDSRSVVPW